MINGKDWRWEEKGTTEDEMVGWHHRLDEYEFGWTLGVGDGQGNLEYCSPWGRKELDTTEQLNWTEGMIVNLGGNIRALLGLYKNKFLLAMHIKIFQDLTQNVNYIKILKKKKRITEGIH